MDRNLTQYISEKGDEFYASISDGLVIYNGHWIPIEQAIEAIVTNETENFSSTLREQLELMADEWRQGKEHK